MKSKVTNLQPAAQKAKVQIYASSNRQDARQTEVIPSQYRSRFSLGGLLVLGCLILGSISCQSGQQEADNKELKGQTTLVENAIPAPVFPISVSENHRYFRDSKGEPFFWLGDTGWLLLSKLDQPSIIAYLKDRESKGFNVIQVMVVHDLDDRNAYGRKALTNRTLSLPDTAVSDVLNYWQLLDFVVEEAAKRNIVVALVPVWGSVVKSGEVTQADAASYARFLANRYHGQKNIVWLNGGDIKGSEARPIWETIGKIIHSQDPSQLMTFHPRGRTQSSTWFHDAPWLDFNCFQSGHRRYDQDTSKGELHYGEDNYRYVNVDYNKKPVKPTLDAEPSYEGIPEGLHDTLQPKWNAAAIRRYAYWSVFAGASGFTYGANSVMQFHDGKDKQSGAYGATKDWHQALQDTAAGQIKYLKQLLYSRPYFERIPDSSLIKDQGRRYNYIAATRGDNYLLCYTFNGRDFTVQLAAFKGAKFRVKWYSPRDGSITEPKESVFDNKTGFFHADPPGETVQGNDWVLVMDKI